MIIETNEYAGVRWLSRELKIAHTTLMSAADAGRIRFVQLPCGMCVYHIEDAKAFAVNRPKRGPKKTPS